jgi:heme/copper-type cytochrome/quinol oxidase subunit 2
VILAVPSAERGRLKILDVGSLTFVPFTVQYARETTPRGVIAQDVESSTAREWLNWIIPIVIVVGAFKYTAWYAEQARARGGGPSAPA